MADDFSQGDVGRAKILYDHEWITKEQLSLVYKIDGYLDMMNENKDLWTDDAVKNAPEWQQCREMGKELLKTLGY